PVAVSRYHHLPVYWGRDPGLQFRHFATATGVLLAGMAWCTWKFRAFNLIFGSFACLAPISYSLYVLHIPALETGRALLPAAPQLLQVAVVLIFLVPACYLLEVRLQRRINRWTDRLDISRSTPAIQADRAGIPVRSSAR